MSKFMDTDFSQFKLRVNIRSNIENAYRAFATSSGLQAWFLISAVYTSDNGIVRADDELAQSGDGYAYRATNDPQCLGITGKVLHANNRDRFGFTFSMECPVSVTIYSEHNETIVELFESKLPTDEETIKKHYVGDSRGWIFYLTNLKSVVEGGLDLRNKNKLITNVITQ